MSGNKPLRGVYRCSICSVDTDRLAMHLKRKHADLDADQRAECRKRAREERPRTLQRSLSLLDDAPGEEISSHSEVAAKRALVVQEWGSKEKERATTGQNPFSTTPLPGRVMRSRTVTSHSDFQPDIHHDVTTGPLCSFNKWLTSIGGKMLSKATADAYTMCAAKLLMYLNPKDVDFKEFLNTNKVGEYLDKMRSVKGTGPAGMKGRLDAAKAALDYLDSMDDADDIIAFSFRVKKAKERYATMYKRFSKELSKQRSLQVEEEHNVTAGTSDIEAILTDAAAFERANRITEIAGTDPSALKAMDIAFIMRLLLTSLTLDNAQRPGPACNMTLREFTESEGKRSEFAEERRVISVREHKTGRIGPAYLVVRSNLEKAIKSWNEHIRPELLKRTKTECDLFLLTGAGKRLDSNKAADQMRAFGRSIGRHVPTATMSRKISSTAVADNLEEEEAHKVNRFMSHTPSAAAKYYQNMGRKRSVEGNYNLLQKARSAKE